MSQVLWQEDDRSADAQAQLRARVALARVCEPMHPVVTALAREVGVVMAWEAVRTGRGKFASMAARVEALDLDLELRATEKLGLRILVPGDQEWPEGLNDLEAPPWCLWVRGGGNLASLARRSIAVVGSRTSTSYGERLATEMAYDLSQRGMCVVSGAAYGIDAAAHRGALAATQPTVAILAGGADRAYPAAHADLLHSIAGSGAVVSESHPGAAPMRQRFLARNRLIAAMTIGTIVVEAGLRSGAINTVSHAEAMCRPVGAIPGPVTSPASAGVHQLVRDGRAVLVTDTEEIIELFGAYGHDLAEAKRGPQIARDRLDERARAVYDALPVRAPVGVDRLTRSAGLSVPEVLAALSELEIEGLAVRTDGGAWRKK